jgi:hypothetical protein
MKQPHTFMSAMIASTCLFLAGGLVVGSGVLEGNPEVRPLARSLGVATVNDCRVRGRIEGRTNGVFAVFDFENPAKEAKEVRFCYLTTCTPPMSLMSRMGPMPQIVKTGVVTRLVKEGSTSEEVLLKETAPDPAGDLLAAGSGDNRITIGMPLFGFDMEGTRRDFLQRALNIKTLRMTRLLPDKLVVRVVERRPIMRMEPGGLVVDDEGVIFPRYVSVSGLPLLTGVDGIQASQGSALTGMARAAVFLITCLEKKPFQLPVTMIDAAMPDYLVLTLIDQKQVTIAWDGMLEKHGGSQEGVLDLLTKLSELSRAMNTPAGRSKRFWNATVKGRFTASE